MAQGITNINDKLYQLVVKESLNIIVLTETNFMEIWHQVILHTIAECHTEPLCNEKHHYTYIVMNLTHTE